MFINPPACFCGPNLLLHKNCWNAQSASLLAQALHNIDRIQHLVPANRKCPRRSSITLKSSVFRPLEVSAELLAEWTTVALKHSFTAYGWWVAQNRMSYTILFVLSCPFGLCPSSEYYQIELDSFVSLILLLSWGKNSGQGNLFVAPSEDQQTRFSLLPLFLMTEVES